MTLEDLSKIARKSFLFSLDRPVAPRLITVFYLLGLLATGLWAINHLFFTFGFGFGNGLWGLLEIAIFGALAAAGLRIVSEALVVYFRNNEQSTRAVSTGPSSLIEDVRDAIEELAVEAEIEEDMEDLLVPGTEVPPRFEAGASSEPARPDASPPAAEPEPELPRRTPVRRTVRRSPRPES